MKSKRKYIKSLIVFHVILIVPLLWAFFFTLIYVGGMFTEPSIQEKLIGYLIGNGTLACYLGVHLLIAKFTNDKAFVKLMKAKYEILAVAFVALNILLLLLDLTMETRHIWL